MMRQSEFPFLCPGFEPPSLVSNYMYFLMQGMSLKCMALNTTCIVTLGAGMVTHLSGL